MDLSRKSKMWTRSLTVGLIFGGLTVSTMAGTIPKIMFNGNKAYVNPSPVIKEGTTYLPIRTFEQLGFNVNWNESKKTVILSDAKNTVTQTLNNTYATANGEKVDLGAAAYKDAKTGSVMVPVRFISRALGGTTSNEGTNIFVNYNVNTKEVDFLGRPIKTEGQLPKRISDYKYYPMGIPISMFDIPFHYELSNWVSEYYKSMTSSPANMEKKYPELSKEEDRKIWTKYAEQHYDAVLNLNYATINSDWVKKVADSVAIDDGSFQRNIKQEANEYLNYVRKNKIVIEGDYYVEPSIYYVSSSTYGRAWVKFKISSPTLNKAKICWASEAFEFDTNVWYEGYVNFGLGTAYTGRAKYFRLNKGNGIGEIGGTVIKQK